jgi:hypothetical protein
MKSVRKECQRHKSDKKIVLQEKRSKITFLNKNKEQILKIRVDGCAIDDNKTLRCDYVLVRSNEVEVYIELKGSHVSRAIEQIKSTIKLLSDSPKESKKHCFVVSTRNLLTTGDQQMKKRFDRQFNAVLQINGIGKEFELSKLN